MPTKLPLVIVADNVRSLHNIGALFRSADAVNLEEIILIGLSPTPPRWELEKTALGATKSVPWSYSEKIEPVLQALREQGRTVYALEQTAASTDLLRAHFNFPAALIVGHEKEGVSPEALALADHHLEIPMHGTSAHSLNVSTASTVALYRFAEQFWYN